MSELNKLSLANEDTPDPMAVAAQLCELLFERLREAERRLTAVEQRWVARDGVDGRSIAGTRLTEFGDLVITFSDGSEQNVGRVVGDPAPAPKRLSFKRNAQGQIEKAELV
jgi:hypothetical protein